jgi:hypothetical protein
MVGKVDWSFCDQSPRVIYTSRQFCTLETRVRLVASAIANVEWAELTGTTSRNLKSCLTVQAVSQHFSLNKKQYLAFIKVGMKLLQACVEVTNLINNYLVSLVGYQEQAKVR